MSPENKKNVPFDILVICYNPYIKVQNNASIISCTLYNHCLKNNLK